MLRATLEAHNNLKQPHNGNNQAVSEEMDTEEARILTFDCNICTEKYEYTTEKCMNTNCLEDHWV